MEGLYVVVGHIEGFSALRAEFWVWNVLRSAPALSLNIIVPAAALLQDL
jgi:hypothetical protein